MREAFDCRASMLIVPFIRVLGNKMNHHIEVC